MLFEEREVMEALITRILEASSVEEFIDAYNLSDEEVLQLFVDSGRFSVDDLEEYLNFIFEEYPMDEYMSQDD